MKILKVEIWNFKSTAHKIVEFRGTKNIVQGDNSVGKSTIDEAIFFALFGTKKDKDFTKTGESRAMVRLWVQLPEGIRKVETTIDNGGVVNCTVLNENNMPLQNPRQLIKTFIDPKVFDPISVLGKDYKNSILRIAGVEVSKEEFEKLKLPIDSDDIKFDSNGLDILLWTEKFLTKQKRPELDREVKRTKGAYQTSLREIGEKKTSFNNLHGHLDEQKPSESFQQERLKIQNELSEIRNNFQERKDEYDNAEAKTILLNNRTGKVHAEIQQIEETLKRKREDLVLLQTEQKQAQDKFNSMTRPDQAGAEESLLKQITELQSKEAVSKEAEAIRREEAVLTAKKEDWESAVKSYENLDKQVIKTRFMGFKTKKMKEIEAIIPGLQVLETGDLLWEQKNIGTLSESERMKLALILQSKIQPKDSVIIVKIGELFDDSTLQTLDIPQQLIIVRVGKSEVPGYHCQTIQAEGV